MTFEKVISCVSLFAVAVAAVASAVQGYVSWTGRNDLVRSTAIAQLVKTCADYESSVLGRKDRANSSDQSVLANLNSLYVIGFSLNIVDSQASSEMSRNLREIVKNLATKPSDDQSFRDKILQLSLLNIQYEIELNCTKALKKAVGSSVSSP